MPRPNLPALPGKPPRVRVLVVGDPCLDEYVYGRVDAVAKEAPVVALEASRRVVAPGQATNVAANAAALGARVRVAGLAGDDDTRERLVTLLSELGVDAAGLVAAAGRRTSNKVKFVAREAQRHGQHVFHCYWQDRSAPEAAAAARLRAAVKSALADADVLVLSDYGNGTLTAARVGRLIGAARRRKVLAVANGRGDLRKFRDANVVVGNVEDLAALLRPSFAPGDVAAALPRAARLVRADKLVITAGSDGLYYWPAAGSKKARHLPSAAGRIVDVTGAGDTVTAALAVGVGGGWTWDEAVGLANLAAAVVVAKEGTATASFAEVEAARAAIKQA